MDGGCRSSSSLSGAGGEAKEGREFSHVWFREAKKRKTEC